jgi:hypothetical protein
MAREDSFDIFGADPFGRDYLYGLSTGQERLGLQPPPQGLPVDTRPYDQMQATPRSFISGLFSDVLGGTLNMPSMPRTGVPSLDLLYANRNPLFNMMGVGDVQKTAERISYGEPLTTGSGMTTRPREETIFAGMAVAPFVGEAANLGVRAGRAGARMVGQGIAENVAMGKSSLPSLLAEPKPSLFAVEPNAMMPKPQAPVSELGFYSAAEQAAMNLQRNKGTGQAFLNDLMKAPDVKKDELSWIGLDDFLKEKPNVTKQEVQDFIANNKIDLQEVRLGAPLAEDPIGIANRKAIFDKYEPEIQALYKEMDNPRYRLVNRGVGAEEYNRGIFLQNKGFRGEPLTAQEQTELNGILQRFEGSSVQEFANAEEARNFYLSMSPEERLQHSIRPVKNTTELQEEINTLQARRDAEADKAYVVPEEKPTKYSKYQLADGENYREILLKLPEQNITERTWKVLKADGTPTTGFFTSEEAALKDASYINGTVVEAPPVNYVTGYKSSHWGGDLNVLAHMRVNDRIDADGKKMLLVEEIQSDWHQAGREKGYKNPESAKALEIESKAIANERKQLIAELSDQEKKNGFVSLEGQQKWDKFKEKEEAYKQKSKDFANQVPEAPFKDTWYQLALKRIMKYAADNGYERVGLTTGEQQAKRYDLSKQVDELLYKKNADGTYQLSAQANGQGNMLGESIQENQLSDYVGKEIATKITESSGREVNLGANNQPKDIWKGLSGIDLKIGGEGMKKYYDEVYPKFLEKYGKKWDAKVGETKIGTEASPKSWAYFRDWFAKNHSDVGGSSTALSNWEKGEDSKYVREFLKQNKVQEPIRYIDITPKMKEGVKKGQPLAAAEQAPDMLASGGLDYADPFRNPLTESTIG